MSALYATLTPMRRYTDANGRTVRAVMYGRRAGIDLLPVLSLSFEGSDLSEAEIDGLLPGIEAAALERLKAQ